MNEWDHNPKPSPNPITLTLILFLTPILILILILFLILFPTHPNQLTYCLHKTLHPHNSLCGRVTSLLVNILIKISRVYQKVKSMWVFLYNMV